MNRPDRIDAMAILAGILLTLLLCAKCSPGQYQSPCINGNCPQQYTQPQYVPHQITDAPGVSQPNGSATVFDGKVTCPDGMAGSGVPVQSDGQVTYVVTNFHVVRIGNPGSTQYHRTVSVENGEGVQATGEVVAVDIAADVVLVRVPLVWRTVKIGTNPSIGDRLYFRGRRVANRTRSFCGAMAGAFTDGGFFARGEVAMSGDSGGGAYRQSDGTLVGIIWGGASGETCFTPVSAVVVLLGQVTTVQTPQPPAVPSTQPPDPQANCNCVEKFKAILERMDKHDKELANIDTKIDARIDAKLKLVKLPERGEPGPAGPAGAQGIQGEPGPPGKDANTTNLEQRIAALEDRKIKLEIYRDGELVGTSEGKTTVRVNIKQLEEALQQPEEN